MKPKLVFVSALLCTASLFAQAVPADVSASANVGQLVTITAAPVSVASDGTTPVPMTLQWQKDAVNIAGATTAVLALPNVQLTASGVYVLIATNSGGSTPSPKATITVKPIAAAPTITTQPKSQSGLVGTSAVFSVVAAGTGPLTYQWMKDGQPFPFPNASATTPTFTNPNLGAADAGVYTCVVTGPGGSVTSAPAVLVIVTVTLPSFTSITATAK